MKRPESAGAASPVGWVQHYGPFALALFFLATSRWGSQLLPGPPYIGDLALGALIVSAVFLAATGRRVARHGIDPWIAFGAGGLIIGSAIWLAFGPYASDALRDAAPYLYAVTVFLVVAPPGSALRAMDRAVMVILVFHAGWVTLGLLDFSLLPMISLPGGDGTSFQIRSDFDSLVCGLLAAIALHRALTGRTPAMNPILACWGAVLVFSLSSRAGLLAFAVQLVAVVVVAGLTRTRSKKIAGGETRARGAAVAHSLVARRVSSFAALAALFVAIPIAAVAAPDTGSATRLAEGFGLMQGSDEGSGGSESTGSDGGSEGSGMTASSDEGSEGSGMTTSSDEGSEGEMTTGSDEGIDGSGFEVGSAPWTVRARETGWRRLADWLTTDLDRNLLGVGMGPNFLKASGAAGPLLGEFSQDMSRHPHNYLLNTWARLGLLGLVLLVALTIASLRLALLVARNAPTLADADVLSMLLAASIPIVAALGVVFETPFGAIPYFWALGHLSARACQLRAITPLEAFISRARDRTGRSSR